MLGYPEVVLLHKIHLATGRNALPKLVLWSRPHTYGKGTASWFYTVTTAGYIMLGIDGNYILLLVHYIHIILYCNSKYFLQELPPIFDL